MPAVVRALRGATTIDEDTPQQITERVGALLKVMFERNGVRAAFLDAVTAAAERSRALGA